MHMQSINLRQECKEHKWGKNSLLLTVLEKHEGNSLVVQWIRLHASTAGSLDSIPD